MGNQSRTYQTFAMNLLISGCFFAFSIFSIFGIYDSGSDLKYLLPSLMVFVGGAFFGFRSYQQGIVISGDQVIVKNLYSTIEVPVSEIKAFRITDEDRSLMPWKVIIIERLEGKPVKTDGMRSFRYDPNSKLKKLSMS